jgi:hypothetical protein
MRTEYTASKPRLRIAASRRRGTAFMEFFFALPFLLFIMVLGMNFCKTYLMQQRAMVAARYVAWSQVEHLPLPTSGQISTAFFVGEPASVLSPTTSTNADESNDLTENKVTDNGNDGTSIMSDIAGAATSVLSGISGTQQYGVQYQYHALFAAANAFGNSPWYPNLQINGTVAVDSNDWRYPNPSFQSIMGSTLTSILRSFGWIVQHI